jgi:hypothetical protein
MKIGDKVICVYHRTENGQCADTNEYDYIGNVPNQGTVHVIQSFTLGNEGTLGFILIGTKVIHKATGTEVGYDSGCFRLLRESKEQNKNDDADWWKK